MEKNSFDSNYDEIMNITGPIYFSNILFEYIKSNLNEKIVVFPTIFFYPFPAVHRQSVRKDDIMSQNLVRQFCTDESYCVHLWYTSWQK